MFGWLPWQQWKPLWSRWLGETGCLVNELDVDALTLPVYASLQFCSPKDAVSAATDEERLIKIHDVIQQLPPPHYRFGIHFTHFGKILKSMTFPLQLEILTLPGVVVSCAPALQEPIKCDQIKIWFLEPWSSSWGTFLGWQLSAMSPTCTARTWRLSGRRTCWGEIVSGRAYLGDQIKKKVSHCKSLSFHPKNKLFELY